MNEELLEQFAKVNHLFNRNLRRGRHHTLPLSGQARAIKLLKLKDNMSQKELSELMGIRPQSTSELINKLERNGYISKDVDENDKRHSIISLTEKGKEFSEADEKPDLFKTLSLEEQNILKDLLKKIEDVLIEEAIKFDQEHPHRLKHHHRGRDEIRIIRHKI